MVGARKSSFENFQNEVKRRKSENFASRVEEKCKNQKSESCTLKEEPSASICCFVPKSIFHFHLEELELPLFNPSVLNSELCEFTEEFEF